QEAAAQEAAAQEAAAQEAAAQEAAAQEAAAQEAAAQEAAAQEAAAQEAAAQEAAAEASKAAQLAKAADEAAKMGSGSSIILEGVTFGNASDVLTADVQEILSGVVETLKNNPGMLVEVAGYTDSRGAKAMNVELSQRRAQSVVNFLVERGVPASQMTAKGYGPESPVADNGTAQGRAQNRRVEMHVK
ncbi:MAG: OmpA family protein, partial [bacterium]